MTENVSYFTVASFAKSLNITTEEALFLFQSCNIFKRNSDSFVSISEAKIIEEHLLAKKSTKHIQDQKNGQIKRRVKFQISTSYGNKSGVVNVEIRKKRVKKEIDSNIEDNINTEQILLDKETEKSKVILEPKVNNTIENGSNVNKDNIVNINSIAKDEEKEVLITVNNDIKENKDKINNDKNKKEVEKTSVNIDNKIVKKHKNINSKKNFIKENTSLDHKKLQKHLHNLNDLNDIDDVEEEVGYRRYKNNKSLKNKDLKSNTRSVASEIMQKFNVPVENSKEIKVKEGMILSEFADKLSLKATLIVKEAMKLGVNIRINDYIDKDVMQLIADNLCKKIVFSNEDLESEWIKITNESNFSSNLKERPPVVTIMGHVDHGKTSLLDFIRNSKVADKEVGGITQKIGSYVTKYNNKEIVFIDTPGHAVFTSMRDMGSRVTDIVIIVIAVEDGIMPQTIESIEYARKTGSSIIVAVTKVDKFSDYTKQIDQIKQNLLTHNIVAEEWGGDTQIIPVSVKLGIGVNELLDAIILQSEILNLQADYNANYQGVIIESGVEKGLGYVANVITISGQLKKGDTVICGTMLFKVRMIKEQNGKVLNRALPSIPVSIYGLPSIANPGERIIGVKDEKIAKSLIDNRLRLLKDKGLKTTSKLEVIEAWKTGTLSLSKKNNHEIINIVLKADTYGSLEAIKTSIEEINKYDDFTIVLRSFGVGSINESDVDLAMSSKAIIIGFNVKADVESKIMIERSKVKILDHNVIYSIIDELKEDILKRIPSIKTEIINGKAEVKAIFRSQKFGLIAGCVVKEGIMGRNSFIKIIRNGSVVCISELDSLRRGKDDVQEVKIGNECGIGIKQYNDVTIGDIIEAYEIKETFRNPFIQ